MENNEDQGLPMTGESEAVTPNGEAPAVDGTSLESSEAEMAASEVPSLSVEETQSVVEALIFASPQPVTRRDIIRVIGDVVEETAWSTAIETLKTEYARSGRGLQLIEVAGGLQITTRPEYNDWVRELLHPKAPTRLSVQALETLAVIAYKQPVTMPEVIELRGVKSGGVIKTLLERRLIRIVGRKEVVGRPMLYGTTKEFLLHFGLRDLTELPRIEEFAEVLGEEIDVEGLKKAIEAPQPVEASLIEAEPPASIEASDATEEENSDGEGGA